MANLTGKARLRALMEEDKNIDSSKEENTNLTGKARLRSLMGMEETTSVKKQVDPLNLKQKVKSFQSLSPLDQVKKIAPSYTNLTSEKNIPITERTGQSSKTAREKQAEREAMRYTRPAPSLPQDQFEIDQTIPVSEHIAFDTKGQIQNKKYNLQVEGWRNQFESVNMLPDFRQMVERGKKRIATDQFKTGGFGDAAQYMNDPQTYTVLAAQSTGRATDPRRLAKMSDTEKETLLYFIGAGDDESAKKYFDDVVVRDLNRRYQTEANEKLKQFSNEHKVLGAGVNILSSVAQSGALVETIRQAIENQITGQYKPVDPYSPRSEAANIVKYTTEGITEDMGLTGQTVASSLLSLGQMGVLIPFGGPAMSAIMGLNAAGSSALEAAYRSEDPARALATSIASGLIEWGTEKLPIDNLFRIAKGGKSVSKSMVKEVLQQAGIEGTEELISEYANTLTDIALNGNRSAYNLRIEELIQSGMSRTEAEKQAQLDFFIIQPVMSFAGGGIAGGIGGGTAAGISVFSDYQQSKSQNQPYLYPNDGQAAISDMNPVLQQRIDELEIQSIEDLIAEQNQQTAPPAQQPQPPMQDMGESGQRENVSETSITPSQTVQNAAQQDSSINMSSENRSVAQDSYDYQMIVKGSYAFGDNGRLALINNYDGQNNSADYYAAFSAYYQAGLSDLGKSRVQSRYSSILSPAQQYAAYYAGQNDAKLSLEREKQQAKFATVSGTESGLVYDDYLKNELRISLNGGNSMLDQQTADRLDNVAKALGVRVRFVDQVRGGTANAQISGSEILVAKDIAEPVQYIVGHEITHRMQQLAPEEYRSFRDLAAEVNAGFVKQTLDNYRKQGVEIDYEQALDEVTADYAGALFSDGRLMDEFIARNTGNRRLLQRVLDAIHAVFRKLTGKDKTLSTQLRQAEKKLSSALGAAARQAGNLDVQNTVRTDGKARYSLREFSDGVRFVDVQVDQSRFDGLSPREMGRLATSIIKEKFGGKIIGLENRAFVNGRTAGEYGFPLKRLDTNLHEAKMRASTELDNLLDAGTNFRTEPDGRDGHEHPNIAGDFQYFDTIFKVGSEYYSGVINLMQVSRGLLLKDITKIKNITQDISSSYGESPKSTFLRDVSTNSIRETGGDVNTKFSVRTQEQEAENPYAGKSLSADSSVYSYEFLTALPDMQATVLPEVSAVRNAEGRVDTGKTVAEGMKNARAVGTERDGKVFVRNRYTGKQLLITTQSIRHGLNGGMNRLLTNARLGAVIGDVVQNAVPINALHNKAQGVDGTYAMASYATDSQGREFVAIVTVEQRNGNISGLEVYDVTHAVSGRQKRGQASDPHTRSRDFTLSNLSKISIADFINVVNNTHQSVLSDDVLNNLGETRKLEGEYTGQVKFSLRGAGNLDAMMEAMRQELRDRGASEAEISEQVTQDAAYNRLMEQYGMIEQGEHPTRNVRVPKKSADGKLVSHTIRTIVEAGATPNSMIPKLQELIADGTFSYDAYTDEAAVQDAERIVLDKGWETALKDWTNEVRTKNVNKENTALGWALYNNAANIGNTAQAIEILEDIIGHQRSAAQALQATRILKKQTPEAQLYGIARSVENLKRELKERYGKKATDLVISDDLAAQFLNAKNDEARERAMQEIYRDIGKQMPSTFLDKWNAWRYLAMLGNPRTHIRNIVGNAFFYPIVSVRDTLAGAVEAGASRISGGKIARTRSLVSRLSKNDRALLSAAASDYDNVQGQLMGIGKYTDSAYANRYIEEGRQIFRSKLFSPIEKARKLNSRALDVEDSWFSKPHYRRALAMYCKANGITAEQIQSGDSAKLREARNFAINQAQKATYRDLNALSYAVSRRMNENEKFRGAARIMNTIVDAVYPYRKTPANILARGIELSPAGLAKGIYQAVYGVHKGTATAAEAIDSITTGLTGTGLLALGFYLASQKLVFGGGSDEDKREFEELMGHQSYAMELGGGLSVTLDWLAPQSLPFFVGVNLYELMEADDFDTLNMETLTEAIWNVTDPFLSMSMLSSLQDMIDSVSYAQSGQLGQMAVSAATSYLTQGIPTLFGQLERSFEPIRMTTYTDKNRFLDTDTQYVIGKASTRFPGDYSQIPYIDAWGRKESTGNWGERLFSNFLSPFYTSTVQTSEMENELLRLYDETGENVFPARASRYFNVDGERTDLTGEQYVKYATTSGQTAYETMTAMVKNPLYQELSDADKAEAVLDVYSLSRKIGQQETFPGKDVSMESWMQNAVNAKKTYNISYDTYILLYDAQTKIEGLKDADGDTITYSQALQKMELVYNTSGLTQKQQEALFDYFDVSDKVKRYNRTIVSRKLAQMYRQ